MHTYRIVLDAYDSRSSARGARVVTYAYGFNRSAAIARLGSIRIAPDGTVSDDRPWPGTNNMPAGTYQSRSLPEWDVVSVRSVPKRGTPRMLWETESA